MLFSGVLFYILCLLYFVCIDSLTFLHMSCVFEFVCVVVCVCCCFVRLKSRLVCKLKLCCILMYFYVSNCSALILLFLILRCVRYCMYLSLRCSTIRRLRRSYINILVYVDLFASVYNTLFILSYFNFKNICCYFHLRYFLYVYLHVCIELGVALYCCYLQIVAVTILLYCCCRSLC